MKKGLLTVLLASLVLVGCQNYDDQFDDLNAQISALKSQVDGLSSLSGQVASLSGSISGLQAGVSAAQAAATAAGASADAASAAVSGIAATDLSGLEASLATLAAEVDAVQASLATAATATAVAALQAELDAIEADVDELLATSNVYTSALNVRTSSELDAAYALGNNINIVNSTVVITQTATMDAAKLQTVIDRIFTVTGSFTYTTTAATNTAMTFDKLASTGDLSLTPNGPISAKALVTAANVTLGTTYTSKVTSINMDALVSVDDINSDTINFPSATDIQLGSLAVYTDALSITTKKGATLDIAALDDLNTAGTAVDMSLTVSGPATLSISGWDDSYAGTISATNIADLTIAGYEGAIVIGDGVENATVTGGVDVSLSSADDLETVDLTTKLYDDPNVAATAAAKVAAAYGKSGEENSLSFSSTSLTSVTLSGYWLDVTSSGNGNLTTVDIDATMRNLNLTNNDNLTSLDVTGASIANVTLTGNDALVSAEFDHTTGLNYNGTATADTEDATVIIKDNLAMTSLTFGANNVNSLTVTGNDALTTVDFTGLASVGNDADGTPTVNIWDNDFSASALDTVDGLITATQEEVDGTTGSGAGTNDDADDLGSYTTTSGMATLSTYLTAVKATARATAAVNFDTVTAYTIAENAAASGQTAGVQNSGNQLTWATDGGGTSNPDALWIGLVYADTVGTYASVTTNPTAVPEQATKRAFILKAASDDTAAASSTATLSVGGVDIFHTGTAYGAPTITSATNLDMQITALKTSAAISRAADLGVTIDVYRGANSTLPAVTFRTSSSSASGSNGEAYSDSQIGALYGGDGTLVAKVTSYDVFTLTVGGQSVTATVANASVTGNGSVTGGAAASAIAIALENAWNAKFGSAAGASKTLSFWDDADWASSASGTFPSISQKSTQAGSRPYGQSIAISHAKATAAQASLATGGAITNTFADWTIGSTQLTTDNSATAGNLIISVEEVTEGVIDGTGSSANQMTVTLAGSGLTELITAKTYNTTQSQTLAQDIFEDDAGIYGSIAGGGAGDVRQDETVNEGSDVTTTSGAQRGLITRLHWLGS
jgi:hypothetical protein